MIGRVLLIANPASRRGRSLAATACRSFDARGVECDLRFTERPGHATELATAARASDMVAGGGEVDRRLYDAVFSLGGDGTAMEVAGALAGSGTPVGVLPGGTGNLLARAIGVPFRIDRAVRMLLAGRILQIDLGRLDSGRSFAIAAGIGIDASMVAETPSWLKRRLGILAYVLMGSRAAFRAVRGRGRIRARVTVDGENAEYDASAVMVANFGTLLNDRITLGEGIRADDGYLDVCIFTPRSLADGLRIMWKLLSRNFAPHPAMSYRRGRSIRVESDPPSPLQADGDLVGETPFSVVVVPRCVQLLVPRRYRAARRLMRR